MNLDTLPVFPVSPLSNLLIERVHESKKLIEQKLIRPSNNLGVEPFSDTIDPQPLQPDSERVPLAVFAILVTKIMHSGKVLKNAFCEVLHHTSCS